MCLVLYSPEQLRLGAPPLSSVLPARSRFPKRSALKGTVALSSAASSAPRASTFPTHFQEGSRVVEGPVGAFILEVKMATDITVYSVKRPHEMSSWRFSDEL